MKLGLGLGISSQNNMQPSQSSPLAEKAIKSALKERKHIRAVREGVKLLIQPYALINAQGIKQLHGVIVAVEGDGGSAWGPEDIAVTNLSSIEDYDLTFVPSDAFDPSTLSGVIAVVEGFDPFQDTGEQIPSAE